MDNKIKLIADSLGHDRVKFDEPLSNHTSLHLGGPAGLFFIAFKQNEIIKIYEMARDLGVPFFIFGTGSKMMISEKGFEGVVIKNRTTHIQIVGIKGKVSKGGVGVDEARVEIDSGLSIEGLVDYLNKQGLQSQEFVGLPGSVGGNLFLNLQLQSKAQSIKVLEDGIVEEIAVGELNLRKHVILSATFRFKAKEI